jgi:purine-binding chemotaxis protein CheW
MTGPEVPTPPATEPVADLGVLREPTRRAIVGLLAERPRRATGLAGALNVSMASMSRHLRILRTNGIVRDSRVARDGRARLYTIDPLRTRQIMAWLAAAEPLTEEVTRPVPALASLPSVATGATKAPVAAGAPVAITARARTTEPPGIQAPRRPVGGPLLTGRIQIVALEVGPLRLAIATERVIRIVPEEPAAAVPFAPAGVIGIMELDGQIVPVIDARTRLGIAGPHPGNGRLVVVGLDSGPVALRVDATTDVGTIDGQSIRPMPEVARSGDDDPTLGVVVLAGRLATLIDPEALVAMETPRS